MRYYFQNLFTGDIREEASILNPDTLRYRSVTEAEARGKRREIKKAPTPSYQSMSRRNDDDLVEDLVGAGIQIGLSLLGGNDDDNGFSGGGGSFGGGGSSADW